MAILTGLFMLFLLVRGLSNHFFPNIKGVPISKMTPRQRERFNEKYDIGGDFWLQRRTYAESVLAKRLAGKDVDPYLYQVCLQVMKEPRPIPGQEEWRKPKRSYRRKS